LGGNSPTSLSEALYGNNAENILDEDVKQYRQLIGKRNRKYSPDEDVSDDEDIEVIEHDIRELSKNAAWKVIKELVDKKI